MIAKTVLLASLITTMILPFSMFNVADAESDDMKQKIDKKIKQLKQDYENQSEDIEKIDKKIRNWKDFKEIIVLTEKKQKIDKNDKYKHEKINAEIAKKLAQIKENAEDRVKEVALMPAAGAAEIVPVLQEYFGVQYASAAKLNDFEFEGETESCWGWNYNHETSGYVDTGSNPYSTVFLNWHNPANMYVGDWPCDNVDYEVSQLVFYGIDDDGNTYWCGASMPDFNYGAAAYYCPWASEGDFVTMSSNASYEDDINVYMVPYTLTFILE